MAGPRDVAPLVVPRVLAGRYKLLRPIARGGMAEVWEGQDTVLSRPVAVKVLAAHLAADARLLERFRREAVNAARLAHPGVVATYDTGLDDGTAFIVMELVRGQNLRQFLGERGPLDQGLAVNLAGQIADALGHAHRAGLIHRDIKPANVLICTDEWGRPRVKVTDFGIARAGEDLERDLTQTGMVLGTPKYLSPEQIRGAESDARADLYALGVVLHEMLAGQAPFVGPTDVATAISHLHDPVPRLSATRPGLVPGLDPLVARLLAKDPDDRPASAVELRQTLADIEAALRAGPRRRPAAPAGQSSPRAPSSPAIFGPVGGPAMGPPAPSRTAIQSQVEPANARGTGPGAPSQARPTNSRSPGDQRRPVGLPRSGRLTAIVVIGVAVAAAVIAALLVSSAWSGSSHHPAATTPPAAIAGVTVFMVNNRAPDDPEGTHYTIDGNPSTVWQTAVYATSDFGGLYPGIGLAIQLRKSQTVHTLAVVSTTGGWSAQVYLASAAIATPSPLATWGTAVATENGVGGSPVLFDLGSRAAGWVLLWLTDLGPPRQVKVAEVTVH